MNTTKKLFFCMLIVVSTRAYSTGMVVHDCSEQIYNSLAQAFSANITSLEAVIDKQLTATQSMPLTDLQTQLQFLAEREKGLTQKSMTLQKQMDTLVAEKNYQQAIDIFIQFAQQEWTLLQTKTMLGIIKAQIQRMAPTP